MPRRIPSETVVPANGADNASRYWQSHYHNPEPWFKSGRLIIFAVVFLLCSILTLSYVFFRAPVYQSYATLLTVAKTAIDSSNTEADIQHVAIQKQILLGAELLAETSKRLKADHTGNEIDLSIGNIRQMLNVKPVTETNLIEMIAEGPDPAKLPLLINTWIDVYLDARASEISLLLGDTTIQIQEELNGLSKKIRTKRAALDQFRKQYDIASIEREENDALARLKGLNEALNEAEAEEVKTKARLDAINQAIARGQAVVPQEDTRTLSLLEDRAQELRGELADLNRRYTREYLNLSPTLKVIPDQLEALEKEIKHMRQQGQIIVQSNAQQEYAAAQQTANEIRQQLKIHKNTATQFTAHFAEHEALKEDLVALEARYRDTQDRMTQLETQYAGKYPQVDVIERAFLPEEPVRPDYLRDAGIAVIGSLVLSLLCVWMIEFLTRKTQPSSMINLSGIHVYDHGEKSDSIEMQQRQINQLPQSGLALDTPLPLEIAPEKINMLLQNASHRARLVIALLLSGVTIEEISTITPKNIDTDNEKLCINGQSPRLLYLNPALQSLFANPDCNLLHPSGEQLSVEDITALLTCAIADADLSTTDEINARTLHQTYLIYLVKQGLRLTELEKIAGYIAPQELSRFSIYQPAGAKHTLHEIDLIYSELRHQYMMS